MKNFKSTFIIILSIFVVLPFLTKGLGNPHWPESQPGRPQEEMPEEIEEIIEQEPPEVPEVLEEEIKEEEIKKGKKKQKAEKKAQADIVETMPEGKFLHPREGMVLKGKVKIKFKVELASSVEFYLRRPEALVEIYLGQAFFKGKDNWEYLWETTLVPNGNYFLLSKIINEYGEYWGKKISLQVENEVERKEEERQELEEEIQEFKSEIQSQEQEIKKEKEKIEEEIVEEIEELPIEIEEMITPEKREKVLSEIKEETKKFSKALKERIKKVIETKEREKRKEIKEEISKSFEAITKKIVETVKEEKKSKALALKEEKKTKVKKALEELEEVFEEKEKIEAKKEEVFSKDSDFDGLPDYEELRLGTDPLNPDSDNDGFLDSSEIALGFDPLRPSPADKIKYQDPQKVKIKISDVLKVEKVEMIIREEERKALKIQGKALPYSFVTIYIYSLPTVVVTKADGQGNWEYILDKPLVDGQHRVYATVTNNHGEIEEISAPLIFIKAGERVLRLFEPAESEIVSPAEALQRSFLILVIGIVILALGIALIVISILLREKKVR